jgi:lysophospholipase L1-like esterase
MKRSILTTAVLGAGALVGLAGEVLYTGFRDLPKLDGTNASGTFGSPDLTPLRIAILGDSSCTGPGLEDPDQIWVRRIGQHFGRSFSTTVDSVAVGGSRASDVLRDQVPMILPTGPDVAIVSVGSNDMLYGVSLKTFERNLESIATALLACTPAILLSGVGDLGTIPRLPFALTRIMRWRSRRANDVHIRVAARHPGVVRIPMRERCGHAFEDPGIYSADLLHVNAEGHRLWAEAAIPSIETAIRT